MPDSLNILLVEDNRADVELTLEAFRQIHSSNQIHVCRDGEEALDFLLRRGRYMAEASAPRPDLILLDLNLPGTSGAEVLQVVKQSEELRNIPIVMLTTSNRKEDIGRCYRLGANSYLTKPVQFQDCVDMVKDLENYWLKLNKLPAA